MGNEIFVVVCEYRCAVGYTNVYAFQSEKNAIAWVKTNEHKYCTYKNGYYVNDEYRYSIKKLTVMD